MLKLYSKRKNPILTSKKTDQKLTLHPSAPASATSNSSLIAALGTEEIDAALDAFRIDLEKEVNLREEKRAQEIEEELSLKEEAILEFEGAQEAASNEQPVRTQGISADSFELDEISLDLQAVKEQYSIPGAGSAGLTS